MYVENPPLMQIIFRTASPLVFHWSFSIFPGSLSSHDSPFYHQTTRNYHHNLPISAVSTCFHMFPHVSTMFPHVSTCVHMCPHVSTCFHMFPPFMRFPKLDFLHLGDLSLPLSHQKGHTSRAARVATSKRLLAMGDFDLKIS